MKRLPRILWVVLPALAVGGLLLWGRGKWLNRGGALGDSHDAGHNLAYLLLPVFTNFYSAEGSAPTADAEKNRTIFISLVTNRFGWVIGEQPPPPNYRFWDDARCFLFLPPTLSSNAVSILLLTASGTDTVPDAWAAVTHYRGNFEVLSISRYSQRWLDTVMSRKPDFYFWKLRNAYLQRQAEEKAATRTQ